MSPISSDQEALTSVTNVEKELSERLGGMMNWAAWGVTDEEKRNETNTVDGEETKIEEQFDPYSLVADELIILSNRIRSRLVAEVPELAFAAEYFFKPGVEGKRFRPTILLLMATALNVPMPRQTPDAAVDNLSAELQLRQKCQSIAEVAEMIHVASLVHDDVVDNADTRRGVPTLNSVLGNRLAVLAGDFIMSKACEALFAFKNTEENSKMHHLLTNEIAPLGTTVVQDLVTGELMQMTTLPDKRYSMEYYMRKTFCKTGSLISHSCKAIALVAGQTEEVSILAFEYGKNLGLAFQLIDDVLDFTGTSSSLGKGSLSDIRQGIITAPILFAIEEFPELRAVVNQGFNDPANVDLALEYLRKSSGIQRTRELAAKHSSLAAAAIESFPENDDEDVQRSRRALVEITKRILTRTK